MGLAVMTWSASLLWAAATCSAQRNTALVLLKASIVEALGSGHSSAAAALVSTPRTAARWSAGTTPCLKHLQKGTTRCLKQLQQGTTRCLKQLQPRFARTHQIGIMVIPDASMISFDIGLFVRPEK